MNNNENNKLGPVTGASREKYWGELTETEKLERTRQVIKQLARRVEETSLEQYHTKNAFLEHKHLDGVVVKGIHSIDLEGNAHVGIGLKRITGGEGDNVYF